MSDSHYMSNPNGDMSLLFESIFGINATNSMQTTVLPDDGSWVFPYFNNRNEANIFQEMLLTQMSIPQSNFAELSSKLAQSNELYSVASAVLNKLYGNTSEFLESGKETSLISGKEPTLYICGLGGAGIAKLYDSVNQSQNAKDIANYITKLEVENPQALQIIFASSASAASQNLVFQSFDEMTKCFTGENPYAQKLVGTKGSLAQEVRLNLSKPEYEGPYNDSTIQGYLFPILSTGTQAYSLETNGPQGTQWKKLYMTAIVFVHNEMIRTTEEVPIRRSLTQVTLTAKSGEES